MRTTKTTAGDITTLKTTKSENTKARVRRVSKDEYVDCGTGEIKEYKNRGTTRQDNKRSLYRTFAELRDLINANATQETSVSFLTLTYAENMTDPDRLTADFKRFWRKYKRHHEKRGFTVPSWITVAEPQARGAFHLHVLFFYPLNDRPFIEAEAIAEMWGQGFIKICAAKGVDNWGAYLTPYLTDLVLDGELDGVEAKNIDGKKKAVLKGERIRLYPLGMRIYRASRNVKRPSKEVISQPQAKQYRQENWQHLTYSGVKEYTDAETGFETVIYTEQYNARKNTASRSG